MSPQQEMEALRKMAAKHPRTGLQSALEKLRADERLNQLRTEIGWKQDRTPAQAAVLDGIPPITAFMGMGG